MSDHLIKRSFNLSGHSTSVALEEPFWDLLKEMSFQQKISITCLIEYIDKKRGHHPLTSSLRVAALNFAQKAP